MSKKESPAQNPDRNPSPASGQESILDATQLAQDGPAPKAVIGIGASAGGLEALETLFEHIPAHSGMAFVVVQHLSPDFRSYMDELLSRRTSMQVALVEDGMPVQPDRVYLIPAKTEMIISSGRLLLSAKDPSKSLSLPIDTFLRSLAQEMGPRAAAVILSGTGSDGSRGISDIHSAGGMVIVQDAESAKFDGMPKSALATGVVDMSLPPQDIPRELLNFAAELDAGRRETPTGLWT